MVYQVTVDARLPFTALRYLKLAWRPTVSLFVGAALAGFLIWRLWRRWVVLFCAGLVPLFLAPCCRCPISSRFRSSDCSWQDGASCWRESGRDGPRAWRRCAALFLAGSLPSIPAAWWLDHTSRMRLLFRGAEETAAEHPGGILILQRHRQQIVSDRAPDGAPADQAGLSGARKRKRNQRPADLSVPGFGRTIACAMEPTTMFACRRRAVSRHH